MALRAGSVGPGLEAGRGAPARAGRAGVGLAEVGRRAPGPGRVLDRFSRGVPAVFAGAGFRAPRRRRAPCPRLARPAPSPSGGGGRSSAGRRVAGLRGLGGGCRRGRVVRWGRGPRGAAGHPVRRRAGSRASGVGRARTGVGPASWTVLAARPPRCGRFGRRPTADSELVRTRGIRLSN